MQMNSTTTSCCVCCKEIPLDAAFTPEGAEYVEHFCGLECYQRFQARASTATETQRQTERLRFAAVRRRLTTRQVRLSSFSPSGRNSPLGETCRYRVCRVIPSSWHRSPPWFPAAHRGHRQPQLGGGHLERPAPFLPARARRGQAGDRALGDQLALELGQRGEDAEDQACRRRSWCRWPRRARSVPSGRRHAQLGRARC